MVWTGGRQEPAPPIAIGGAGVTGVESVVSILPLLLVPVAICPPGRVLPSRHFFRYPQDTSDCRLLASQPTSVGHPILSSEYYQRIGVHLESRVSKVAITIPVRVRSSLPVIKRYAILIARLVVFGAAAYSPWIMWQIVSKTRLMSGGANPTVIQLDFLQAAAFLVAWSVLLITVTAWILNKVRDNELRTIRTAWEFGKHLEEHPDIEGKVESLEKMLESIQVETSQLKSEIETNSAEDGRA